MSVNRPVILTTQESGMLKYLRALSCVMIVCCHYCQSLGSLDYAFLFNIGVQFFFCISGFLYGTKEISSWKSWWIKKAKKLYVPFILFCIPVLLYVSFRYGGINWSNYLAYLTVSQVIYGEVLQLAHLWFFSAILICYLITPILQALRRYADPLLIVLAIVSIVEYSCIRYDLFHYSWLFLYSFAYLLANSKYRKIYAIPSVIIVASLAINFDLHDYAFIELPHRISHDWGALSLFILLITVCNLCSRIYVPSIVSQMDEYSMAIYIVHGAVLVDFFSFGPLFDNTLITTTISGVLIIILSLLLKRVSDLLFSFF